VAPRRRQRPPFSAGGAPVYAGIDSGSRAIKVALVGAAGARLLAAGVADQDVKQRDRAAALLGQVLADAGFRRRDLAGIVATGYGREALDFADDAVTEITCQAMGTRHRVPTARTVLDIGGQDAKVLRLDEGGRVRDFVLNDRCAAGTGRFLEVVAARLGVSLNAFGLLASRAPRAAAINSTCVVFAESEIIGLLAGGEPLANIAAGVQAAVAARIAALLGRRVQAPVVLAGGVALVPGMRAALQSALRCPVRAAPRPQVTAALGAALLARASAARPDARLRGR
jgi:predicted CoA-substrate-specific enzyme activase